jgi:hypothetical protein
VAAGSADNSTHALSRAELYDPAAGSWTATASLTTNRHLHTATLLPNGRVLAAGGEVAAGVPVASAELYDVGLGFSNSWRPRIAAAASSLALGASLLITGSQFRGLSEGSGGNSGQDSASDYPLVQLRSLQSEQTLFLLATNWQTNSVSSAPVSGLPPGFTLATIFVNGIPGTSSVINVSIPVPTPPVLANPKKLPDGSLQFTFTNNQGALFAALASTNPALPASNWTVLAGVPEISPGHFQFADPQAANNPRRFYRVRSP